MIENIMEENANKFIVFVDTSYLTYMPAAEKADWNRLLVHAKTCVANLDTSPRLEVHISEISLREYRGKMRDDLISKISKVNTRIRDLQKEWHGNNIAKELDHPFSWDESIFPQTEEIESAADRVIAALLRGGIKQIDIQEHHNEEVLAKYFNWESPFNVPSDSQKDDRDVREKRRTHIPDAWILEAAIDEKNLGNAMLCLCKDDKLSDALEFHGHQVFKSSNDVLEILFPPETTTEPPTNIDEETPENDQLSPLDKLLSKTHNKTVKDIYLRLLGFVAVLDTPSHEALIDEIAPKGFDRKLIEACAIILSDKSEPYIKDTGSHYIVGNKEICADAADRLTDEIIDMLG